MSFVHFVFTVLGTHQTLNKYLPNEDVKDSLLLRCRNCKHTIRLISRPSPPLRLPHLTAHRAHLTFRLDLSSQNQVHSCDAYRLVPPAAAVTPAAGQVSGHAYNDPETNPPVFFPHCC